MLKMAVLAPIPSASVTIATAENAGFLINCRNASRRLLIPKCDHWIDPGGAARRNKTGSGGNQSKHSGDGKIGWKVRIEFGNRFAQRRAKNVSPLTCPRTNKDRAKLRSRRCAQQWHVKSHALGLLIERTLHQGVRHHSDNGSPRLRIGRIK